jgi:AcrR family transcriptional regulator
MSLEIASARPKQVRLAPEVRRSQIVKEATRLISRSGFNAVTLADIGAACGIRPPSVLHYFPTMNDILAAVLVRRDEETVEGDGFPSDLREPEQVRAYLRRVVEHNVQIRELVRLYSVLGAEAINPSHPAHDYFTQRNRLALGALEDMLAWKRDPYLSARELLAFWQGLETLCAADESVDFLAVWESFIERFFAEA